jgi:predicted flavoprotein YhiN
VILATGGLAGPKSTGSTGDGYYIAEKAGLKCTDRYPALVPLLSDDPRLPQKSGVRMLAEIRLLSADQKDHGGKRCVALEYGEVQLTSNGVSGIPALQLSRYVEPLLAEGRKVDVSMDFFPAYDDEEFRKLCEKILEVSIGTGRTLMEVLDGFSNHYLGEMVLAGSGIARGRGTEKKAHDLRRHNYGGSGITPDRVLEEKDRDLLLGILHAYRNVEVNITGTAGYDRAQVTAGGVDISCLTDDLEAVGVPGLYVVGELTDTDGRCGGYNLQWAWTSGTIAGRSAGKALLFTGL